MVTDIRLTWLVINLGTELKRIEDISYQSVFQMRKDLHLLHIVAPRKPQQRRADVSTAWLRRGWVCELVKVRAQESVSCVDCGRDRRLSAPSENRLGAGLGFPAGSGVFMGEIRKIL